MPTFLFILLGSINKYQLSTGVNVIDITPPTNFAARVPNFEPDIYTEINQDAYVVIK